MNYLISIMRLSEVAAEKKILLYGWILENPVVNCICRLWKQNSMNVRENTTGINRYVAQKFVQFLVVIDSECEMTWHDAALLVFTGGSFQVAKK
jgi:hypothetical protein